MVTLWRGLDTWNDGLKLTTKVKHMYPYITNSRLQTLISRNYICYAQSCVWTIRRGQPLHIYSYI